MFGLLLNVKNVYAYTQNSSDVIFEDVSGTQTISSYYESVLAVIPVTYASGYTYIINGEKSFSEQALFDYMGNQNINIKIVGRYNTYNIPMYSLDNSFYGFFYVIPADEFSNGTISISIESTIDDFDYTLGTTFMTNLFKVYSIKDVDYLNNRTPDYIYTLFLTSFDVLDYAYVAGQEYDKGYEFGFNQGFNAGEVIGYGDGYNDGYNEGFIEGESIFVDLDSDGYDDTSYTAGKTAGENAGHYDGILWAYTNGFSEVGLDPMMSWDGQNYYAEHLDDTRIAITTFIPGILGSIFAFFFQLASIEFLGISALEVIAMFAVIAVSLLVFKAFFSK